MEVKVQSALHIVVPYAFVVAVQTIEIAMTIDERTEPIDVLRQCRVGSTIGRAEHQARHDDDGLAMLVERLTNGLLENAVRMNVATVRRYTRWF